MRNFFLVTLTKGEERLDSRGPGRLAATLETPGRYVVELDLVDEGIAWFSSLGSPTVLVRLDVLLE